MTWPTGNNPEDKYARTANFLMHRLSQMESYHNHKETMAHAALALLVGVMIALVSAKCWPPSWISNEGMAALGVSIVWFVFHVYIRWQLQNRRYAAAFTNSAALTLASWARTPPTQQQLRYGKNLKPTKRCLRWIDLFFPRKIIHISKENEFADYPEDFINEMEQCSKKCDRVGIGHEWAMSVISLLILVAMLLRTLLD